MNIFKLLKNPFVRNIGICVIIYFALFSNKDHPDSLGRVVTKDNIKKGASELKDKAIFISANIAAAKEYEKRKEENNKIMFDLVKIITVNDMQEGYGEAAFCGDEISFGYQIFDQKNQMLTNLKPAKIIIGENKNILLEKKIFGMKRDGVRIINIPKHLQTNDSELRDLLSASDGDLKYQINVFEIIHSKRVINNC